MMRIVLASAFLLVLFSGCTTAPETTVSFSESVEQAHAKVKFHQFEAVQFDLELMFGGKERLKGTLTLLTNSTKGRIDYTDGRCLIYDAGNVYYSPEFTEQQASFAAYTWSYFFLLPYKISDQGTGLIETDQTRLNGIRYDSKKLIFEANTGASPDDRYIMYADTATHLLHAASYIVTASKSATEAEKDPHAIQYLDYQVVKGIPIATEWRFWGWQPDQGFTNLLGEASLSNVRLFPADSLDFSPREDMLNTGSF
jgi:hypothetical protein